MKRTILCIAVIVALLGGGLVSPAGADSGFLTGIKLSAAKIGGRDVKFTVEMTTLTSTTSTTATVFTSPTMFSDGFLDFGDGNTTTGTDMMVEVIKSKKRGNKGFTNTLQGMVTHTYPDQPDMFNATVSACCEGYLYDGYPSTVPTSIALTDMVTVSFVDGDGCDAQPTALDRLNCLFDELSAAVAAAGIEQNLTDKLLGNLTDAQEKVGEAQDACLEGNENQAQNRIDSARDKIQKFLNRVNNQRGQKIDEATADDFLAQGEQIKGLLEQLLANGVCDNLNACVPGSSFAALNCELDALITAVNAAGLDADLTAKLVSGPAKAKTFKEEAEAACVEGEEGKAAKRLKKADNNVKKFQNLVRKRTKKGLIPQTTADDLTAQADKIRNGIAERLATGVCS